MGQRQEFLKKICIDRFGKGTHLKPTNEELMGSNFSNEIKKIYTNLNGQLIFPPTRFGSWDIDLKDFIIELDEERHFNRYRLQTLQAGFYTNYTLFDRNQYRNFCITYELECLKAASWGKNWKNTSTEKQFGISNDPKNLSGNGSSRWKQRAFYDFLKDVTSKLICTPVIRISIWESFKNDTIDQLLKKNQRTDLLQYIEDKIEKQN